MTFQDCHLRHVYCQHKFERTNENERFEMTVIRIANKHWFRGEMTLARQRGNLGVHYMKWDKAGIYT